MELTYEQRDALRMVAMRLREFAGQTTGHSRQSSLIAAIQFAGEAGIDGFSAYSGDWNITARRLWATIRPLMDEKLIKKTEFLAPSLTPNEG